MTSQTPVRFAVIGLDHFHIYQQTALLLEAGAELVGFCTQTPELDAAFRKEHPQAALFATQKEILEDERIHLIVSAGIPNERAPLGIDVMQHGKDFMSDKPGFTTLTQLEKVRQVAAESGQIYAVSYGRLESRATEKASELVQAGAIGRVLQTVSLGPHRPNLANRPSWFFERERYGGILCDVATHHADYFLHFTGANDYEIVSAQVANWHYPQHPELEDFGDVTVRSGGTADGCSGYFRVDWFTPDGLPTWGDSRLMILGTDGTIEIRSNVDLSGRSGGDHLFLADRTETRYVDCSKDDLPYWKRFLEDIRNRTETAMTQAHCFRASELALMAQAKADRLGHLASRRL